LTSNSSDIIFNEVLLKFTLINPTEAIMPKQILPDHLREQVTNLITRGMSTIDIYDLVIDEAALNTESEEQVIRCISSIRSKVTFNNKNIKPVIEKNNNIPARKSFDTAKHIDTIEQ